MELEARNIVRPGHRHDAETVAPFGKHAGQTANISTSKEQLVETIVRGWAGLDVHKQTVETHVRRMEAEGRLHQETRHAFCSSGISHIPSGFGHLMAMQTLQAQLGLNGWAAWWAAGPLGWAVLCFHPQ